MNKQRSTKPLTSEEVRKKYNQYKSIVLKWENAFLRGKGRKPNKDDFHAAPKSVHLAYVEYIKLRPLIKEQFNPNIEKEELNTKSNHKQNPNEHSPDTESQRLRYVEMYNPDDDSFVKLGRENPRDLDISSCPQPFDSGRYFRFQDMIKLDNEEPSDESDQTPLLKLMNNLKVASFVRGDASELNRTLFKNQKNDKESENQNSSSTKIPKSVRRESISSSKKDSNSSVPPSATSTLETKSILNEPLKASDLEVEEFDEFLLDISKTVANYDASDSDIDLSPVKMMTPLKGRVEGIQIQMSPKNINLDDRSKTSEEPVDPSTSLKELPSEQSIDKIRSLSLSKSTVFSETVEHDSINMTPLKSVIGWIPVEEDSINFTTPIKQKVVEAPDEDSPVKVMTPFKSKLIRKSTKSIQNKTPTRTAITRKLLSPNDPITIRRMKNHELIDPGWVDRALAMEYKTPPRAPRREVPAFTNQYKRIFSQSLSHAVPNSHSSRTRLKSNRGVVKNTIKSDVKSHLSAQKKVESINTENNIPVGLVADEKSELLEVARKVRQNNKRKIVKAKEKGALKRKASDLYDFPDEMETDSVFITGTDESKVMQKSKRAKLSVKAKSKRKVEGNFQRLNLEKKVFVRGKRKMSGFQHWNLNFKVNKAVARAEHKREITKCKKCGIVGHYAKFCLKVTGAKSKEEEPLEVDESPFPSIYEVAALMKKSIHVNDEELSNKKPIETSVDEDAREIVASEAGEQDEYTISLTLPTDVEDQDPSSFEQLEESVEPNFPSMQLNDEAEIEQLLAWGLEVFGYENFRDGQKDTILRILKRQSTLVVFSTGSGKSLCYLLPALIFAKKFPTALTICVSPLVSLMEDQVQSIPASLKAACLHTNLTLKQREVIIEKLKDRKLSVLLVSPEAICSGLFGLLNKAESLPPIPFVCIDEVHCISEWSHNFRPSYLKLCAILRQRMNIKTFLGLTATATNLTVDSICTHLEIDSSSVIRGELVPSNLRISCSKDLNRDEALITLLRSDRFSACDSIIIYCTRRDQCDRIASLIRSVAGSKIGDHFIGGGRTRRPISTDCETYHAGMSSARRKSVQNNFMNGRIRIVVATVAFGMGINKSDIRAVIHYNMPKTFESYIQEIGRAGRDGLPAECHVFLDRKNGKDIAELKRHVYSNSVDRMILRKLLKRVFVPCSCLSILTSSGTKQDKAEDCTGHEVTFSVENTIEDLDLLDANIETILCQLELYPEKKLIELLPKCYHTCLIQSYGGNRLLKSASQRCTELAAAIALAKEQKIFNDEASVLKFNYVDVASTCGWKSPVVRKELKNLEWNPSQFDKEGNPIKFRKSGLVVEFSELAYRVFVPESLSNEECDKVLNYLYEKNVGQEKLEIFQLYHVHQALDSICVNDVEAVAKEYDPDKSNALKQLVVDYFNKSNAQVPSDWIMPFQGSDKEDALRHDIRLLLNNYPDIKWNGRAIARIFHGIHSPCFPSEIWGRNQSFWRKYLDVDFHFIVQLSQDEIY